MLALILAATIQQSIDPAVETVLQAHNDRIVQLEFKLAQRKQVMDSFAGCVKSAFAMTGADLVSTAGARERCPECAEQNPLAVGDLGLIGLKFGQLGSQIVVCKTAAEGGTRATKLVTWTNRIIHGLAVVMNGYSAVTGKPLIRWREKQP